MQDIIVQPVCDHSENMDQKKTADPCGSQDIKRKPWRKPKWRVKTPFYPPLKRQTQLAERGLIVVHLHTHTQEPPSTRWSTCHRVFPWWGSQLQLPLQPNVNPSSSKPTSFNLVLPLGGRQLQHLLQPNLKSSSSKRTNFNWVLPQGGRQLWQPLQPNNKQPSTKDICRKSINLRYWMYY